MLGFTFTENITPRLVGSYCPNGLIFTTPRDCGEAVLLQGCPGLVEINPKAETKN
jgi:hypothetical protein